jgi:hypothetical protein
MLGGVWDPAMMSGPPPIISPPVIPPRLPAAAEQSLQKYLTRCKVLCTVAASLFLVGVVGGIIHYVEKGSVNLGALGFGVWYVLMAYGAALLLHRRKSEGYLAAFPCMLIMLLLIPAGTVFGILGLMWLNKARPLLKRV